MRSSANSHQNLCLYEGIYTFISGTKHNLLLSRTFEDSTVTPVNRMCPISVGIEEGCRCILADSRPGQLSVCMSCWTKNMAGGCNAGETRRCAMRTPMASSRYAQPNAASNVVVVLCSTSFQDSCAALHRSDGTTAGKTTRAHGDEQR